MKLEYEKLLDRNQDLHKLNHFCDSVLQSVESRLFERGIQINALNRKVETQILIIEQWEKKYDLADDQIKRERKRKRIWQITTGAGLAFVILLAL